MGILGTMTGQRRPSPPGDMKKKVPFTISRDDGRTLVRQVVDGFCQAILGGYYAHGDVLPPYSELAPMLGVSQKVTKTALRRLSEQGLVAARPRIGTVVRDLGMKQWRGHVVFVYERDDGNYIQSMLAGAMRDGLQEAGYLFSQAMVRRTPDGKIDVSHLDAILSRSVDLAMVMFHRPEIYAYFAKRHIPYAVFGEASAKPRTAVGSIHFDYNAAVPNFAAACLAAGIRDVVEVYWNGLMCDVAPTLKEAGVRVRKLKVPVDESVGRLLGVRRAGRLAFEKIIADGRVAPAYFLADDYLCCGALQALSGAGIKAPEDVRLATWANARLGPDYRRPLARMEMDSWKAGATVAAALLRYLKTGKFPVGIAVGPTWIDGETLWLKTT